MQVTDAREQRRTPTRLISVDNVLQYASEIPSGQQRHPPLRRSLPGRAPIAPRLASRLAPQNIPARSTKLSEKLVLLPETPEEPEDASVDFGVDNDAAPMRDDE